MMLTYEDVLPGQKDLEEVRKLYNASFPEDERMDFEKLEGMQDSMHRMLAWYDGDEVIGMTFTFQSVGLTYLSYLCVQPFCRDRGYGSKILSELEKMYARIVIDIERIFTEKDTEQIRRRKFYLRAGFHATGVFYHIYHVDYELLCTGRTVTKDDWNQLIHAFWGSFADTAVITEETVPSVSL